MGTLRRAVQAGTLVGAAVGFSLVVPSVAGANPPAELGGLNLAGYCASLGYAGVTLIQGTPVGPNFAYNNWRCVDSNGATHPFSMEQACQAQWGVNAVLAQASDPNNAYTWNCYAAGNANGG